MADMRQKNITPAKDLAGNLKKNLLVPEAETTGTVLPLRVWACNAPTFATAPACA